MPENRAELPLISVIVPVYKAERYIERCVKSLAAQTYKNIEFLLIFDGVQDKSFEICRRVCGGDGRFKLIRREHGGVSAARNAGLEMVRGEYIGFVDSDDYVDEDMYEYLYTYADRSGADVVQGGNRRRCKGKPKELAVSNYNWDKLYRRKKLDGIYFRDFETGEDLIFNLEILHRNAQIYFADKNKYHYERNKNGLCGRISTKDRIKVSREMLAFAGCHFGKKSPEYKRVLAEMLLNHLDSCSRIARGYEKADGRIKKYLTKTIRVNMHFIRKYPCFDLKHRIRFLAAATSLEIYGTGIRLLENF